MKKRYFTFIACLFTFAIFIASCGDSDSTGPKVVPTEPDISETILQELSKEYSGTDLDFTFENGVIVTLANADNTEAAKDNITIRIMDEEQYFNTENDIVIDFSKTSSAYTFNFKFAIAPELPLEDISIIEYLPSESTEELQAKELLFNYNNTTGEITGQFKYEGSISGGKGAFTNAGDKYTRIVISYANRMKLAEGDEEIVLQMPYYEQPGASCWATCAEMFSHAYAQPKDNYYTNKITDFVKYIGHTTLNDGIGLWDFKRNLPKAINMYGKTTTLVSTFVSKTNLLKEVIAKLKENKPLIMNLTYPNVGRHAIVVVGYKIEQVSLAKIAVKLLIHNPQNISGESMNKWVDFGWLMKEKSFTEAYQILYSTSAVPNRTPVTVGMPIDNALGELKCVVESKGKQYSLGLNYDQTNDNAYTWAFPNGNQCKVLPDTSSKFSFNLPVYNASATDREINYTIKMTNNNTGKTIEEIKGTHIAKLGNSSFSGELPINFYGGTEAVKGTISIEIEDKSNYTFLDGFRVDFQIDRTNLIVLPYFSLDYVDVLDENGNVADDVDIAISDLPLKRSGLSYTGDRTRSFSNAWGDSVLATERLEFAYDNADKPTVFNYVNVKVTYSNAITGVLQESYDIRFSNVPAKLAREDIKGWYSVKGDDVCGNIDYLDVRGYNNYKCSSTSGMTINFRGF